MFFGPAITVVIVLLALILSGVKILREYERGVVFTLREQPYVEAAIASGTE